jgi:hypothetical protein
LSKAYFKRYVPRQIVNILDAMSPAAIFNQQYDKAAYDQRSGYGNRVEELSFDGFVEKKAEQSGRKKANQNIDCKTQGGWVRKQ